MLGVQWHPEEDGVDRRLFEALVEAARGAMSVTEVINPATEEVVASVEQTSAEETDAAIARAHRALPAWRAVAPG